MNGVSFTPPGPSLRFTALVPVYNERENLGPLLDELERTFEQLGSSYEILLVDDGSTDGSGELLDRLARAREPVRAIHLERNSGQSAALAAGFEAARGDYIVTLDADLQNDPADVPRLLEWIPQYDMVVGIRQHRQDTWLRRASSRIANAVRSRVLGDGVRDTGCSLKVFRRELTAGFPRFQGLHRFLPALARMQGANIQQVPVRHRPRHAGAAKYNVRNRLGRGLADLAGVWWIQRRWIRYRVRTEAPRPETTVMQGTRSEEGER